MTRRSAVVAVLAIGLAAVTTPQVPRWVRLAGNGDLESAVSYGAAVLATMVICWTALVASLAVVDARLVRHVAPRWALSLLLGGTAVGLLAAPATATTELDGLRLPDRPTGELVTAVEPPAVQHEVQPGDTLWHIAARHLPPDHELTDVAAATAAWHERNREVIGADPDLLVPGQVLVAPEVSR